MYSNKIELGFIISFKKVVESYISGGPAYSYRQKSPIFFAKRF